MMCLNAVLGPFRREPEQVRVNPFGVSEGRDDGDHSVRTANLCSNQILIGIPFGEARNRKQLYGMPFMG